MKNLKWDKKLKQILFGIMIATFIAFISTLIYTTSELAEKYYYNTSEAVGRIPKTVVNELTAAYAFLILVPLMIYFFKRIPLNRDNIFKKLFYYILISIFIGLAHTAMMYFSRVYLYPILGLGEFDYGYIPIRVIMEYFKQLALFGVAFIVFTLYKTSKERELQRIRTIRLEEQLTKARLETLKMQLNPHFLFNTLNMISSTMYEDINAADKMIATLSDLLRITLKSTGKGKNALKRELEILDLYLSIMKERFKDKLDIEYRINENTINALIPIFFFQPLVENSIKYCMENLTRTDIKISSDKKNDNLILKISDNGPGINEKNEQVIGTGIGLTNTVERLEKLFGKNHEFGWENIESGGMVLTIKMPFTVEDDQDENSRG